MDFKFNFFKLKDLIIIVERFNWYFLQDIQNN